MGIAVPRMRVAIEKLDVRDPARGASRPLLPILLLPILLAGRRRPPALLLAGRAGRRSLWAIGDGGGCHLRRHAALVSHRNRLADQLFDVAQECGLLGIAERDGDTLRAGARGAADAVDVG